MELTDIESFCKSQLTNLPGIKSLSLVDASNVSAVGDIAPGATVYKIEFRRWSGGISDKGSKSRSGDYYTKTATIYVPRFRYATENIVRKLKDRKVVVLVVDNNGENHRIDFAEFISEMSTGEGYTESNGYRWTFTGVDRKVAFFADAPEQVLFTGDEYIAPEPDQGILAPDTGGPNVVEACCITVLTTPILFTPEATGNVMHRNKVVTVAATGEKYFIDKNGVSILLAGNGFIKERIDGNGASEYPLASSYDPNRVIVNRTQNVLTPGTAPLINIDTFTIEDNILYLPNAWPLESGEYIEIYKTA